MISSVIILTKKISCRYLNDRSIQSQICSYDLNYKNVTTFNSGTMHIRKCHSVRFLDIKSHKEQLSCTIFS
jgi:hypothetical protein